MRTIAAAILALIVFSCDDDKGTAPFEYFMRAEKNTISWEGPASASYSEYAGDTLFIFGQGVEEVLVMKIKFTGTGYYALGRNQGNYYNTLGGDVIISQYRTDDGAHNGTVRITHYDEETEVVEGNFDVTLKKIFENPPNNTDAVNFTRGQFKVKITRY